VKRALWLVSFVVASFGFGAAAVAQSAAPSTVVRPAAPSVDIVKVQGVIDPAVASYVRASLEDAERVDATVILQIDSPGTYGESARLLGNKILRATVPVIAWVGPVRARAEGGSLFVVYSASLVAVAPGAGLGPAIPFDLARRGVDPAEGDSGRERELASLARRGGEVPEAAVQQLISGPTFTADAAVARGAAALTAGSISDLLAKLDGRTVPTAGGPVTLATFSGSGRGDVRFHEIGFVPRILHAVSTPTAVYVLLVLGLWLVAFELTQPGFGVAGIAGALSLALAGYGLTVIPVHWLGLALLGLGMAMQGADILIRRVAWLTLGGTALFATGSVLAWRGVAPAIDLSGWLIVLFTVGGALFFGFGMTVALRARERVRTAQVGLVGLVGEARADLDPEGAVFVKGTLWRARSKNGPIPKGRRVRVRGIDGLILRVEEEPD
jgi:membrane-bound serine protease (ClpP class)